MSEMKEWIAERQIDLLLNGYTIDDAYDKACMEWADREADYGDNVYEMSRYSE